MSIFTPAKKHYVYIIREKGFTNLNLVCKIGLSVNPEQRIKTLQGANSRELQVYEKFHVANSRSEGAKIERKIQKMVGENSLRGEWFKFNPNDFRMNALPEIQKFVDSLNVEQPRIPLKTVAEAKWTLAMHNAIKLQQAKLETKKRKNTITLAQELHLKVIEQGLDKQANYEKQESKRQHEARVAKKRANDAKKLLEIGVFK